MDGKPVNPLDDLDVLLRSAMSVEPSADFLPRVRERISSQPVSRPWSWRLLPALAIAVATVLTLTVWPSRPGPGLDPFVPAPSRGGAPLVASAPAAPPAAVVSHRRKPQQEHGGITVSGRRAPKTALAPETAVVIVDQGQRDALATLMRMVNRGRLTQESFAQTQVPSETALRDQVVPVTVAPVEVSPIGVGGVLQK